MFDIIREKYLSLLFFFLDLDVYFLFRGLHGCVVRCVCVNFNGNIIVGCWYIFEELDFIGENGLKRKN